MADLAKALAELGITAVVVGLFFYVFMKIHLRALDDAKEDRKENRKVQSDVADAINRLAESHERDRSERLQDRIIRETARNNGERP